MLKDTWILFDLDGTLTQSEEGIWNCVKHAVKEMGLPEPDAATLRKFIGPPLIYSFRTYMGFTAEQAEEAQKIYRARGQSWASSPESPLIPPERSWNISVLTGLSPRWSARRTAMRKRST